MQTGTHNRGFASMDRERQREIARKGGKAAHTAGTAHEFTAEEAREAGRKGGSQHRRRAHPGRCPVRLASSAERDGRPRSAFVVVSAGSDADLVLDDLVNEAVLIGDPA